MARLGASRPAEDASLSPALDGDGAGAGEVLVRGAAVSPAAPVAPRAPKFHLAPNPVQAMPILELTFYAPRQNLEKNGLNLNTPAPGASVE